MLPRLPFVLIFCYIFYLAFGVWCVCFVLGSFLRTSCGAFSVNVFALRRLCDLFPVRGLMFVVGCMVLLSVSLTSLRVVCCVWGRCLVLFLGCIVLFSVVFTYECSCAFSTTCRNVSRWLADWLGVIAWVCCARIFCSALALLCNMT